MAAALLTVHALMLAWGAYRHSPTEDEIGHLAAGLQHWQCGRFDLFRVNPPLVRLLATAPVILAGPQAVESARLNYRHVLAPREEFRIGAEFVRKNGERSFWLFALARWACIPFSLLGGYVCLRWAGELYGSPAGIVALLLWCFSPNILAHAQLLTPDAGAAALGISAAYCFWRWLQKPGWPRALGAGVVLGLAELTKMTWIVLLGLWPVLWLLWRWSERGNLGWLPWRQQIGQLTVILVLGVELINFGYGFEDSFQRLDAFTFLSSPLTGKPPVVPSSAVLSGGSAAEGNRFVGTWVGSLRVPLPRNYLQGIDRQKWDFERRQWSFLRGQWRTEGWWYYYLYCLAIKGPCGTWLLILLALTAGLRRRGRVAAWRNSLVLLAPAAVVLALVSSQTSINHHLRYVLPILPFVFIWASQVAVAMESAHRKTALLAAGALAWSVGSSLWIYPHSLSYFNETVGGPTGGPAHLADSNVDWGQDLLYLRRWLVEHPEARPLGLAYTLDVGPPYTLVDPRTAGIEYTLPPVGPDATSVDLSQAPDPSGPLPGWYAVSVGLLHARTKQYACFTQFRPVAMAGYSIYIYHVTADEARRVRRESGVSRTDQR